MGPFKLSYFSRMEEKTQYRHSGSFLILVILQDISRKNNGIKNISRPADRPNFPVYKTIKISFFIFSPFFIKMAVSRKLRSTKWAFSIWTYIYYIFDSVMLFQVKHLVLKIGENILTKISWNPVFSDSE